MLHQGHRLVDPPHLTVYGGSFRIGAEQGEGESLINVKLYHLAPGHRGAVGWRRGVGMWRPIG